MSDFKKIVKLSKKQIKFIEVIKQNLIYGPEFAGIIQGICLKLLKTSSEITNEIRQKVKEEINEQLNKIISVNNIQPLEMNNNNQIIEKETEKEKEKEKEEKSNEIKISIVNNVLVVENLKFFGENVNNNTLYITEKEFFIEMANDSFKIITKSGHYLFDNSNNKILGYQKI